MRIIISLIVLLVASIEVQAAKFSVVLAESSNKVLTLRMEGVITPRDIEDLRSLVKKYPRQKYRLYLSSEGGSLGGGMSIGWYIKDLDFITIVEDVCHSSCVSVFFAGNERRLMPGTSIGVNLPKPAVDDSSGEIMNVYFKYWTAIGAPVAIFADLRKTPASAMYRLSHRQLEQYGVIEHYRESPAHSRFFR